MIRTRAIERSRAGGILVVLTLFLACTRGALPATEVTELKSPRELRPGQIGLLESKKGMSYFARIPKSYNPKRGARLVVFLHGSNMNGLTFLRSFETKRWCVDDILVCPNGEQGEDPRGQNNFTFSSAEYVAGLTREVQEVFRVTRTYVGGFSQGGYLTYSVFMLHPDLYQGAIPMAGGCWTQNEPNLWENRPEIQKKQKEIAIAFIHGKSDSVVKFGMTQHAFDIFLVSGYPKLRLFAPEKLGHQFMLSPVAEALEWLDMVNGIEHRNSTKRLEEWAKEGEWGWVVSASRAAVAAKRVSSRLKKTARGALKAAEAAARKQTAAVAKLMDGEAKVWLQDWWKYRERFGGTDAAKKLVAQFEKLRARQRQLGARLFGEARAAFRGEDKETGNATLQRILREAPASYHAYYALKWLED